MNTLKEMVRTIFLTPGEAALEAEKGYRRIWADWIADTIGLAKTSNPADETKQVEALRNLMQFAPIMKINGQIELGLTMRVASVEGGKGEISLGTGPIGITGGYYREESQESVMTIHGTFTLTNTETDLTQYLALHNITLATPADVTKAVDLLSSNAKAKS
jgi:hypothetical protein